MNILLSLQTTFPDVRLLGTPEITCTYRIAMERAPFNKKGSFDRQTELKFKEEASEILYSSTDFYAAKNWTVWKVDQNYLGSF